MTESTPPADAPPGTGRLNVATRLGYGLGDFGFVAAWQGAALFLLYFYTDVLHLSPWMAGAIYLAGMVWDAISDPLIASWTERHAAQRGRYSTIMRWAALPVGLSYLVMFSIPTGGTLLTAAAALLSHLVFRTAYTCASMPYNTLPARLTGDSDERSALSALRVIGAALGGLTVAIATPLLVQAAAEAGEAAGYRLAAVATGALAATILIISSLAIREPRIMRSVSPSANVLRDLRELWRFTVRNGPLQRLLTLMLLATIGFALFTQSQLYFLQHVLQQPALTAPVLAGPALAMIVTAPLWMMLAARTSKRATLMAGLLVAAAGYVLMGFAPAASPGLALLSVAVIGTGSAAIPVMFWSMVPDVIDHGQLQTGLRVEARTFGLTTFVQKCAAGIAALVAGGLLALSGYAPDIAQPSESLGTITALVSWLPAAFMLAMVAVVRGYPVSREHHSEIIEQLGRKRGAE
tara:strand:+ start:2764 stop:4158 length:1395 start_codon:yes stop_codon:yes gene_type:complete